MKFVKKRLFLCKKIHLLQLIPIVHEPKTNGTARYIFRNGLKLHAAAFQKNITKVSPPQRHIRFLTPHALKKHGKRTVCLPKSTAIRICLFPAGHIVFSFRPYFSNPPPKPAPASVKKIFECRFAFIMAKQKNNNSLQ